MSKFVEWSNELSVGIEEIDTQHQVLVDLLNQIHEAIQQRHGAEVTQDIVLKLDEYTRVHFAVEESLMRISAYPDFSAHKGQHAEFVAQVQDLRQKIKTENAPISFELLRFLRNWLLSHIDESDKRFGQFYRQGGHAHYAEWQQEVKKTLEKKKWWQFW